MEVTEILEKFSDDDENDIPDNVIYVIFSEKDSHEKIDNSSRSYQDDCHKSSISYTSSKLFSLGSKDEEFPKFTKNVLPDYSPSLNNIMIENIKRDVATQTNSNDDLSDIVENTALDNMFYQEKNEQLELTKPENFQETRGSQRETEYKQFDIEGGAEDQDALQEGQKPRSSDVVQFSDTALANRKKKQQKGAKNSISMKCKHCSQNFFTFSSLLRHSKSEHDSTDFSFPCNLCGQSFTRPHNLSRHIDTRHRKGEKKYECERCGRKFGRQDIFASHMRLMHSKEEVLSKKTDQLHQCSSCRKFFAKLHNYTKHCEGNFACVKCSQSFACKRSYREHLNKQHSVTCDLCGKTCPSKQQMYAHKLSHAPKFNCEYCGKGFVWESPFIIHMATHTGIRPLNCDICGKSFAHANAVKKHKWQDHTEANRKHRCKLCGKGFVYKAKLDTHIRIHSGKRPYPCLLCSTYFSQQRNLLAHMKVIHGTLPDSASETEDRSEEQDDGASSDNDEPPIESPQLQAVNQLPVPELTTDEIQALGDMPVDGLGSEEFLKGLDSNAPIYHIIYTYPSNID